MGLTVFIISAAYRGIIEEFPHGGGGYAVATKLLGKAAGVTSGSALLVDYILTITASIAAAGTPSSASARPDGLALKMPIEIPSSLGLTTLNLRGAKESAIALAQVFILFCVTHLALIVGGIVAHVPELPATARAVGTGFHGGRQRRARAGCPAARVCLMQSSSSVYSVVAVIESLMSTTRSISGFVRHVRPHAALISADSALAILTIRLLGPLHIN